MDNKIPNLIGNLPSMIQKKGGAWVVKRDKKAFQALYGVLKGKKMPDPVKWQRKIRAEMERSLP